MTVFDNNYSTSRATVIHVIYGTLLSTTCCFMLQSSRRSQLPITTSPGTVKLMPNPESIGLTMSTDGQDRIPDERLLSNKAWYQFLCWTALFWGGTVIWAILFFTGVLSFLVSTKISLYGISIWLNGWIVIYYTTKKEKDDNRSMYDLYHDCLVVWLLSYMMTNVLWEIPWLLCSPFVFDNIDTTTDLVDKTDYMRESIFHMYYWVLSSFGSVDLRTVNHDATFYTIELYSFINIITTCYFFYLNKKRSPYRYLVVVLGCGEPVAATLVFSFVEVVGGFPNMTDNAADILLALVWTQYQYVLYPLIFGYIGSLLLLEDWRKVFGGDKDSANFDIM